MDATDFFLLWFGASCLGAALITVMCQHAPQMDWTATDGDVDFDEVRRVVRPPLHTGEVLQRRAKPAETPTPMTQGDVWDRLRAHAERMAAQRKAAGERKIIPVTDVGYPGHDGRLWYACAPTTEELMRDLEIDHYANNESEDDGA